ncbi:MAG: hypothetical protein KY453_08360 [Gemmatimonadetes bacterium]|nr:hypothetical protein [Gemmatimonadota bacterium]
MTRSHSRLWTDRDGTEWTVEWNPSVELDTPEVRRLREGILFRSGERVQKAPAVFGSDLSDLTGADLQGLLDQAVEARDTRGPWEKGKKS